MDNPHTFHIHTLLVFLNNNLPLHLKYHQSILPQFHILNQETLPLTPHHSSPPQLHILNQVNLLVEVPHHSHLRIHQKILLPMSPVFRRFQVFHHHALLITHQCNIPKLQLFLPLLLLVTFPANIPQFYSSIILHGCYPALHHQDLI